MFHRKPFVLALSTAVALALVLGSAPRAAAATSAPSWTTGDFWTWTWTAGGVTSVRTWTVLEHAPQTVAGHAYDAWHVNETVTVTTTSGSSTTWNDLWIRPADLGFVKRVLGGGAQTFTYDPPLPQASFPLEGNSWYGSTTVTHTTPNQNVSTNVQYSGTALAPTQVTVPKGTFQVVPVRSPSAGSTYTMSNYSDSTGNFVEVQTFSGGQLATDARLTDYRYQAPGWNLFLLLVGGFVALGGAGVAVLLFLRRRHRAWSRSVQPAIMRPPSPPQPPQGGPPSGPPGM